MHSRLPVATGFGLAVTLLVGVGCATAVPSGSEEQTPASASEVCNGLDDDGDGAIDEGEPDYDGDGVADCVDFECSGPAPGFGALQLDETCRWADPDSDGFWVPAVEWRWRAGDLDQGTSWQSRTAVALGFVEDTTGEGVIDDRDELRAVVATYATPSDIDEGTVVVLDPQTGTTTMAVGEGTYHGSGQVLVADLHPEEGEEILAFWADPAFVSKILGADLISASGETIWSKALPDHVPGHAAVVEAPQGTRLLIDSYVVDPLSGSVEFSVPPPDEGYHRSVAADLDGDLAPELFVGWSVYSSQGVHLWDAAQPPDGEPYWWSVMPTSTGLGRAAWFASGGEILVYAPDGLLESTIALDVDEVFPPCTVQLGGEPARAMVIPYWSGAGTQGLIAVNLEGDVLWDVPVEDSSGLASCSSVDLDGDGDGEVLYAGESEFRILSVVDGQTLGLLDDHRSGTSFEYPVPGDIDSDGRTEILVGTNGAATTAEFDWQGIRALQSSGIGWAPAPGGWSGWSHPLGMPGHTVGLREAAPPELDGLHDLAIEAEQTCVSGCAPDGVVMFSLRVSNRGAAAWSGVGEIRTIVGGAEVASLPIDASLLAGDSLSLTQTLPRSVFEAENVEFQLLPAGDCELSNNSAVLAPLDPCPSP